MTPIRVWVRSLGNASRVRVEGMANANLLLDRLGHSFIFKNSEPFEEDRTSSCFSFLVPYGSRLSRAIFEKALIAIPGVQLMAEPA
ncbi:MAG: hypothetical protein K8T25_07875 [Planctomycetia bacterium]|nr:hypothetical protein [Planctomycetia bacterium]